MNVRKMCKRKIKLSRLVSILKDLLKKRIVKMDIVLPTNYFMRFNLFEIHLHAHYDFRRRK